MSTLDDGSAHIELAARRATADLRPFIGAEVHRILGERAQASEKRSQFWLQAFMGLFVLGFGVITASEWTRLGKVSDLAAKLETQLAATERLENDARLLVGTFANVLNEVSLGYYNVSRAEFRRAAANAEDALLAIDEARLKLGRDSKLEEQLGELQLSALTLKSRALASMNEMAELRSLAEQTIRWHPNSWIGYHYRGIARLSATIESVPKTDGASDTGHSKPPSYADALEDFEKSVELNGRINVDRFNIAELSFVTGRESDCRKAAERFVQDYPDDFRMLAQPNVEAPLPPRPTTVARMYELVSQVLECTDRASAAEPLEQLREFTARCSSETKPLALRAVFDGTVLNHHLKSYPFEQRLARFANDVSTEASDAVTKALQTMVDAALR